MELLSIEHLVQNAAAPVAMLDAAGPAGGRRQCGERFMPLPLMKFVASDAERFAKTNRNSGGRVAVSYRASRLALASLGLCGLSFVIRLVPSQTFNPRLLPIADG